MLAVGGQIRGLEKWQNPGARSSLLDGWYDSSQEIVVYVSQGRALVVAH